MEPTPALGRPRSPEAHRAVLDAAMRLVVRDGYAAVTIKGIAEEAGVGRQTVYRWWTSKAQILLEAVRELAVAYARPEPTGDAEHDLRALLNASFALTDTAGRVIAGLIADATQDREFHESLQADLLRPRRELVRAILEGGQRSGQFGRGADVTLLVDLIWGTMWYRVQSGHNPVDEALAEQLTDAVRTLLGPA